MERVITDGIRSAVGHLAVVIAGFAQIGGIALFFFTMWSRIRPAGSQSREAKGEKF